MHLKRIKVVPSGRRVRVMGFAPAARGAEMLIGSFEMDLSDVKRGSFTPAEKHRIGLDLAPEKRVTVNPDSIE